MILVLYYFDIHSRTVENDNASRVRRVFPFFVYISFFSMINSHLISMIKHFNILVGSALIV